MSEVSSRADQLVFVVNVNGGLTAGPTGRRCVARDRELRLVFDARPQALNVFLRKLAEARLNLWARESEHWLLKELP